MKQRHLWLILAPVILAWFFALLIAESGDQGTLKSDFLRNTIYPRLNSISGSYTDIKFRARGPRPVQQKIVIIEIDDRAINNVGRWPWHRDAVAMLAYASLEYGAKVVGLDIVFPEMDQRVPDEVAELLQANGLGDTIPTFETDLVLKRILDLYKDKIVLGWMSDTACRPAYGGELCDVIDAEQKQFLPLGFEKFAFDTITGQEGVVPHTTQLASAPSVVSNRDIYNESAAYSGFLVNAVEDSNDVVRRAQLSILVDGKPHPSLPLVMAGIGLEKKLAIKFSDEGLIDSIGFDDGDSDIPTADIPVSKTGALSINFRGAGYHFSYVGAWDIFTEEPEIPVQQDGIIRTESVAEIFKDAYVLIGVSAIGARDLRTFPFGNNILGTEGLATILDNILSGDAIERSSGIWGIGLLVVLMTLGAAGFGLAMVRLTALPAILASLFTIGAIAIFDTYYIFGQRNINLNTILLLGQLSTIFVVIVVTKYILEERRKRMIRGTFSKYLAPAVVDEMLKDPDNIKLGGEARELTIMMSDLRGFTATAERLSAEKVLEMLNHYLGTMADIIVDFEETIDEFIGDAILVIFGAPFAKDDDARRAVACCLAMQKAMAEVNAHNTAHVLPTLEMGIALNTGEVTVG
ncbi:MAG: adenylate/guanylate cyclase domain-containing protein, partial [Kofleriaceae bacterium]|nr:adenylate/guanylate cyclase domain-containing protein [Kofleriaceae bacterium]